MDAARLLLVVDITAVVLAFALTLPTIASLIRYFDRRSEAKDRYATYFYADRDGEATSDAVAAVTRWKHRLAIAGILVVVCGVALSRAIASPAAQDRWMHFGISALLLVQGIALLLEPQSVARFSLGLQISANALITIITLLFQPHGRLIAVECASLFLTCFLSLLLSRRPDVCRNGKVIDGKNSTSFLGRITCLVLEIT